MRSVAILLLMVLMAPAGSASELKTFAGTSAAISQHVEKGKWLVVMIWASDCHFCNQEARNYDQFYKKHKTVNATMLGLSIDGKIKAKEAEKFVQRHELTFPNLLGERDQVMSLYFDITGDDKFGTPTFLIYNPKGELIASQVGAVPPKLIEAFIKQEGKAVN